MISNFFRPLSTRLFKPTPPSDPKLNRWKEAGFAAPPPHSVKYETLLRHGMTGGSWIETGTYLGQMTRLLASSYPSVITIEPEEQLAKAAIERLAPFGNVKVMFGSSEEMLTTALGELRGRSVNFWLDGHYSGDGTFHGSHQTPIVFELEAIRRMRHDFADIMVFVDDFRLFSHDNQSNSDYPSRTSLVKWADSLRFGWSVENDIFIAGTKIQ